MARAAMRHLIGIPVWFCAMALPVAPSAYEVDADLVGATLGGQVVLEGRLPKLDPLPVHRDSAVCGARIPNEALVVDPDGKGISAVVISLEGVQRGKPVPPNETVIVKNLTCRFVGRASAATVGASLELRNNDPILHNTHVRKDAKFGPTVMNVAQPVGVRAILKPLTEPGLLDVRCDAHPFMRASIHVFDHPYHTVTDAQGRFELNDVPAGAYTLRAWHELLGSEQATVTVTEGGRIHLTINMAAE